jgi:hypothetical protein
MLVRSHCNVDRRAARLVGMSGFVVDILATPKEVKLKATYLRNVFQHC